MRSHRSPQRRGTRGCRAWPSMWCTAAWTFCIAAWPLWSATVQSACEIPFGSPAKMSPCKLTNITETCAIRHPAIKWKPVD